jgi:hypothetical protein
MILVVECFKERISIGHTTPDYAGFEGWNAGFVRQAHARCVKNVRGMSGGSAQGVGPDLCPGFLPIHETRKPGVTSEHSTINLQVNLRNVECSDVTLTARTKLVYLA